jgi:hypothetical protein
MARFEPRTQQAPADPSLLTRPAFPRAALFALATFVALSLVVTIVAFVAVHR